MARSDIQIFTRKESITILTKENQFTYSRAGDNIALFTTAGFTMPMLDELDASKIVQVEHYTFCKESGTVKLNRRFGFSNESFTNTLIYLIEKYGL
jgi:hypothetical protein